MKRRLARILVGLLAIVAMGLAGCGKAKSEAPDGKVEPKSLAGTGDNSNMPPEARRAMEEARRKAGPPAGFAGKK